jgi:hypothetical protein
MQMARRPKALLAISDSRRMDGASMEPSGRKGRLCGGSVSNGQLRQSPDVALGATFHPEEQLAHHREVAELEQDQREQSIRRG